MTTALEDAPSTPPEPVEDGGWLTPARKRLLLVVGIFLVTRLIFAWIANHPSYYGYIGQPDPAKGYGRPDGTGDVRLYDFWSWNMRHLPHSAPYADQHIEYPPGALPFMFPARYLRFWSYRAEFILLMVGVDAFGLWGVYRLAKRVGCWWGVVAWLALMPALGPVTYTRIDLAVAAALVWMLERAAAKRWGQAGGWLGFGIAAKLIPGLLLLQVLRPAEKRRMVLIGGAALVGGLMVAPFLNHPIDLWDSVIGYHTKRGVQAESLWAAVLLAMKHWGSYPAFVHSAFGAYDISSPVSPLLKTLSNVASVVALVVVTGLAWRWVRKDDVGGLALACLATLSLNIATGRVYSPQYLMWVIAVAAVALTFNPRRAAPAAGVLTVVVLLSHLEFPYLFWDILFFDKGGAIVVLLVRDFLTPVIGLLALVGLRSHHRAGPLPSRPDQPVEPAAVAPHGYHRFPAGPEANEGIRGARRNGARKRNADRDPTPAPASAGLGTPVVPPA